VHHRGHQDGPQDEGVQGDGGGEPDAELRDDPLTAEDEGDEDGDHDGGGGGDDPSRLGLADVDRARVVLGVHPLLVHPADQEHLVVHGQAEQHGKHTEDDEQPVLREPLPELDAPDQKKLENKKGGYNK